MFCGETAAESAVQIPLAGCWKQSSSLRAIQQAQWRRADGFIRWDNLRLIGEIQIKPETRHKIYALLATGTFRFYFVPNITKKIT